MAVYAFGAEQPQLQRLRHNINKRARFEFNADRSIAHA